MAPLVYGEMQWNRQLLCLCEARGGTRGPGPHRSALCKTGPDCGKLVRLIVTCFLIIHLQGTRNMFTQAGMRSSMMGAPA